MSILSDYKRHVEEPRIASYEATIRSLRQRVAELEAQPPLPEASGDVELRKALEEIIRIDQENKCGAQSRMATIANKALSRLDTGA